MGQGERSISIIVLALCVAVLAGSRAITIKAAPPKEMPSRSTTEQVIETTEILKQLKTDRSSVAPVDCEALYDLLQAAQAVYLEQCPGV